MEDFDDLEDGLFRKLRTARERKRSLESTYEDITDSSEGLAGEWDEWMCPTCGVFLKEHHQICKRCKTPR